MDVLLGFAAVVSLAVFFLVGHHFVKEIIAGTFKRRDVPLVLIGVSHFVYSVVLWLWASERFTFILSDYIIIFSGVVFLQAIALTGIMYNAVRDKKVFYVYLSYLVLIPLVYSDPANFHLIVPLSFLIILLSFTLFSNLHRKINQTPILYSAVSLIGYIASIIWTGLVPLVNLLSALLFLSFIYLFMKRLRSRPELHGADHLTRRSFFISFFKHFAFIVVLTNFVFVGAIGAHELGHVAAAKLFDCQNAKIVVEFDAMPHTQTTCSNAVSKTKLLLGGILAPFIVALLLLFSGGKFMREIALQIFAINIIISYKDLLLLGISLPVVTSIRILGIVLGMLSIGLLAKSKTF